MRQHASKQNSIPNNLRVLQNQTPAIGLSSSSSLSQIGTKDTNARNMGQSASILSSDNNSNSNDSSIAAASTGASGSGGIGPSAAGPSTDLAIVTTTATSSIGGSDGDNISTMPSGKFAQLKSIRVKDTRDAKAKRNEWRITKMVLAIFLSFVLCYLPITLTKVADKDVQWPFFHIIGYIMLYLSSCINPIIYVIMNKQYRQAYKTVNLCQPARWLGFTHGGSSVGGKTNRFPNPFFFVVVRSWFDMRKNLEM